MELDQPKIGVFYRFGAFLLNANEHLLTKDGEEILLPPKAFALLVLLVENSGSLLKKETLLESVWPEVAVEEGNIPYNISLVRKALGDTATNSKFVTTVPKIGYRFVAEVQRFFNEQPSPDSSEIDRLADRTDGLESSVENSRIDQAPARWVRAGSVSPFKKHYRHLVVVSILYALYFSVAFLLEIAYQYERYGSEALKLTPLIFIWAGGTSIVGLVVGLKWTSEGRASGLLVSLTIFLAAALLLYVAAGIFLPNIAITQATFQTYPAHGAFLKSIYYVIPLIILFVVVPFHFVVAIENQHLNPRGLQLGQLSDMGPWAGRIGSIYLKSRWLALILFCTFLAGLVGMSHLFDNLRPNPNMGLFIQLAQWKFILYFLMGSECLLWYQLAKGRITRKFTMQFAV